jgi:hypothetical protein
MFDQLLFSTIYLAFVKRLQSGEIDVSKINKYRDRGSRQWQEEMKRATDATCGENEEYVFDVGCDLASMSPSSPVFIR